MKKEEEMSLLTILLWDLAAVIAIFVFVANFLIYIA